MLRIFCLSLLLIFLERPLAAQTSPRFAVFASFESQIFGLQTLDTREPSKSAVQVGNASLGAGVGVLGTWRLFQNLHLQPELMLSYTQNSIWFRGGNSVRYPFWDLEMPLHFVLNSSEWNHRIKPIFLFGARAGFNMARNPSSNLYFLREKFALDLGMGIEFFVAGRSVYPELIYAHGLNNIHDFNNTEFDWIVGRAVRDRITLRVCVSL